MAFSDALKKYREAQGYQAPTSEEEEKKTGVNPTVSTGTSFSDKLKRYREEAPAKSLEAWGHTAYALMTDVQNKASKWHGETEYKSRREQATKLLGLADSWRKQYAGNEEAISYIDSVVAALEKADSVSFSAYNFFSGFKDEDDYNFVVAHSTPEKRQAWYKEQQDKVDDLGSYYDNYYTIDLLYQDYKANPSAYTPEEAQDIVAKYEKHNTYKQKYGSITDVKAEIEAAEAEMRKYERGQNNENGRFYGSKVVDDNYAVTQRDDFGITSAKRDYKNPTPDEYAQTAAYNDQNKWYFDEKGVYRDAYGNELEVDEFGNWINPQNKDYLIEDKLGLFLNATEEHRNKAAAGNWGLNNIADTFREGLDGDWKYLDPTEVGIYYTYLGESQEKAYQYLADMERELDRRRTLDEIGQWSEQYNEASFLEKIGMSFATMPAQLISGAAGTIVNTIDTLQGEEINPYSTSHSGMHYSQTIRGARAEEFSDTKIIGDFFTLGDLYQAGMSIGDSFLAIGLGGSAGGVILASSAAQSEAYRLYQQGASSTQIAFGSTAAFVAEQFFESISIGELDKIKNMASPKTLMQFVKTALVQGGVEASEEIATEIANIVSNSIIMASQSDWAKQMEKNDGNWWKTFGDKALDVLHAGLSGFISGVGSGTIVGGTSYDRQQAAFKQTGKTIKAADGGVDALKALANDVAGVSKGKMKNSLTKQASKIGEKSSARKVGRLYSNVQTANKVANSSQNQADIAKSLQRKGFNAETSNDLAAALVARYNGQPLTKAQSRLLESAKDNTAVQKAISDIISNEQSTVGQRQQNIRDFNAEVNTGIIAKTYGMSKEAVKNLVSRGLKGKSTATAETVYEGGFEVSKEGKASIDGKEVKLDGLQETGDGVMVATADGQTADGGDITFPSKGHALVYEGYLGLEGTALNPVIKGMSVASRSVLARAYDLEPGTNGKVYFEGANQTYWYGFEGMSLDALPENSPIRSLNEEQIKIAYEEGRKAGRKATDTQDRAIKAAHKAAVEKLGGKKAASNAAKKNGGAVILENNIQESAMTKKEKASKDLADRVAQAIGKNIHVYRGMQEYGKYDPATGEIWLNINGNISGSSMMAFALSHELVHMAKQWSPSDFKVFADYLVEQYGKKGYSVEKLVRLQMDNAIDNGYTLDEHEAYEEVIADACQRMLLDSDALQKMAGYRVNNPDKWQRIVDAIRKFINNVRKVFKGADPDSLESALFKEFDDAVKNELEKKFVTMVMNASEHMNTIQNAFGKNTVVEVNANGEFTLAKGEVGGATKFLYNDSTWEKGGRDTLEAALKAEGFSREDIDAALTIMDGKHKLVKELAKKFPEQARINKATITTDLKDGHSVLSALVSNGDYPVNIDLLMVCKKRKAYQRVINRLCETGLIQQATVDALAIAEINKILGKYGFETACLGCFVESRRLRIQEWAETIVKEWNSEVKKRNPNAKAFGFGNGEATLTEDEVMQLVGELEGHEKNDKGNLNLGQGSAVKRMGVLLDKVPSLAKTLAVEDLITPDGLTALRKYDSNLFSMVKSRYGSNSPKFVQEFNPYNHELAMYGKVPTEYESLRDYLYAIGGARMQSFSDFIVENWFDYCQIVADLAARKLPMHTYTKEITLAKLFGLTGIKINMSLIPDIDRSLGKEYAGLTFNKETGEYELIWADKDRFKKTGGKSYMQSINFADAIALQSDPRYSSNVGTIAVGVSDKHILMMLDDARIRMVIPYHSSGMNPIFADLMGTSFYKDYTMSQNTTVKQLYNSKGQKVSLKLDKTQTGKLTSGFQFNEVLQELGDARAAAETYKEWCADASKHTITIKGETYTAELTPKFNDFSGHKNYYKLLEDFNTYDCISEQVAQQGDVQQVYPDNFDEILKGELKAQEKHRQKQETNQAFDNAMGEIETYLKSHTKADTVFYAEQHGIKLSAKDKKLNAADKAKIADLRKGMKMSMPKVSPGGYQMSEVVEGKRDLLAFHNITAQLLQEALNRNGLVMPSLAITNKGMNDFGEISLLFDKSTIDPNQSRENKLYGADAWTPTQTNLKKNAKFDTDKTVRAVNTMKNRIGSKYVSELLNITPMQFKETILQADGSIYDAYAHNIGVQTAYAMESGIISKIPTTKSGAVDMTALQDQLNKELDTDNGWRLYKRWLNNISDTVITSYDQASNEDILNNMKAQPASAKTFKLSETGELVVPAAEYGSIKDLRKNKSRLSENAEEAAKAVADEFMALAKSIGNDTKAVVDAINTAFAARYNTADIMKTFRKQGINITSKTAGDLQSLYKKAVELPTQYFEAKPQREVGLDEIKAVVMPADAAYAELKGKLEDLGISVIEYDGTKESRVKALNSVESLKFSMPKVKAPTFYSHMARVVDALKQEKFGASSVLSTLRNKGVKAEEIKWSGIEEWLHGKKSVTKAELQEFIAGSMLQIEEDVLDNKERPYTEDQKKRLDEYEAKREEVRQRLAVEWKKLTGKDFHIPVAGDYFESVVVNAIIDENNEQKEASFEGKLLKKLKQDVREVIENNDDFGFDSWMDAINAIRSDKRDFVNGYDMSTDDKVIIVKYINALDAFKALPNKISYADADRLRAIASETDSWNRKIRKVEREHNEEAAKHMPNWKEYSLKGGKNYREMLFRIPGSTYSNAAMFAHWKEKEGVLAHTRIQDMDTANGRMLFIEEIQSDWHNEGHKEGYRKEGEKTDLMLRKESKKAYEEFYTAVEKMLETNANWEDDNAIYYAHPVAVAEMFEGNESHFDKFGFTEEQRETIRSMVAEEAARQEALKTAPKHDTAPDAPFKDTYHEYVMKRLLREAAEQGYDSIGWTTSDVQMDRWNPDRKTNAELGITDAKNPDAVAFEEAYRNVYDRRVKKFLENLGDKWGATVGRTTLDNGTEVWSMDVTDSMKDSVLHEGQPKYSMPKKRTFSYNELVARGSITGEVIKSSDYVHMKGGLLDEAWLVNRVKGDCKQVQTGADNPTYYAEVPDIGRNVKITNEGILHGCGNYKKNKKGVLPPGAVLNARITTNLVNILRTAIEVNQSSRGSNIDVPFSHIMLGVAGLENTDGSVDYYAVRIEIEERAKRDSILVGANVLGRLYAVNANKISSPHVRVTSGADVALTTGSFAYNIAELLKDVKKEFNDTFSLDVYKKLKVSRFKNDFSENLLFKTPNSRGISPRQLLANAFDSLAQKPKERELMAEYRKNIAKVEVVQERLKNLRGKISELTKSKGDKGKIAEMNKTAKDLADLIDKYDRKLLELEASKPLRDVLARAKSAAYQEARERSEKSLKEYRQQVSERFDRGVEGRRKTEMRKKIRRTIRELDKILNRGDKKRNVKEDMKDFVAEALSAADVLFTDNYTNEDIVRNGFGVELSTEEAKYLEEARGFMNELATLPAGGYDAWQARQEAEEKLKSKLAYRMSKLKDAFFRERQRLNKAEVSEVLGNLADAYAKLETSEYAYVNGAYYEPVYQYLKMLQEDVGGAKVKDMTLGQLEELHKAYTMVLTTVQNANKMFADDLKQSKEELANRVMMEVYNAGGEHGLWSKGQLARNQYSWNNTKPIYAAERTGSSTFVKLVQGLFKGQYKWATDMEEAKAYRQKVAEKYGFKNWDMEKTYKFTSSSGIEFELNLNHIMALYAYAKREQAHDHLLKGGFVFGKNTEVVVTKNGIKRTYLNKSAKAHNISDEIMGEIVSKLSEEQKGFVDEMQDYLSTTMGNKGNEISMRLYGVKLFMEKFYFPLRSAGQFKEKAKEAELKQQQGQISIANSGFTHATTPKASNPVVLDGFTDVWASHVNEMSLYHSMVLPMEDFRRVYNYASPNMEGQESASVNSFIENAYGDAATGYFDQLYKELNGGTIVDPRENLSKQMIGKFKKSAVLLSNSVWVQQFSAIGRTYALINPKYFIGAKVDKQKHADLWSEMKQYAPVAIIKEMGGFDTHTGLGAKDYLLAEEYGKGERIKGFFKDEQYRNEVMGWAPAMADELTWCAIWEAVKRETNANNPKMDVKSEEFLKKVGERFSEIIEKTQVYDSVLARSANMRSKNGLMQMLTAFMAEPTTTVNMVEDALRKGDKKTIARTFGAVAATILINNALASLVYGMRDDDEDETFLEKYVQAFTSGMLDDINPMTYYPILKDVWSLFQGYDIERSDMAIYSDITDSIKKVVTLFTKFDSDMDEDDAAEYYKQVGDALMSLLDAGASAFGIPWKNARRDLVSYFNTVKTFARGGSTTWNSFVDTVGGAALDNLPVIGWIAGESKTDKLYDAITSGDTAYVNRLKGSYKDADAYSTAVRKALRDNDPRVREAAQAQINGNPSERVRIAKLIIADGFAQDDVVRAINSEINALTSSESTSTKKEKGYYTAEDFAKEIANGDQAAANAAKVDIIQTAQKNGKTEDEAKDSFASSARGELKELFLAGKISEDKVIDALVSFCDMDESEAELKVESYAWEAQGYEDVTSAAVRDYNTFCASANVPKDVYLYIRSFSNDTENDKGADGKSIAYSAMKKVMAEINAQAGLTAAQKTAIAKSLGWSDKNIQKYKTW